MPRSIIVLALLVGCNYDYAFLGWSEQTVSEPLAVDEPDLAAIATADTGDLPPEHTDEVVLSEEDTDTYSGDIGGTDAGEHSTDTDTGELPEDTDPPADTDRPLDAGSPPDSDPPTDVWVDTDPPIDTGAPPSEEPGCKVTVGVDEYNKTYYLGDTALGGRGFFSSVSTSVGISNANSVWDNINIDNIEVVYSNSFDTSVGWTYASGCYGNVTWSGGSAVSHSDWAYIQETTTPFSTIETTTLAMDTIWSSSTNSIALGVSATGAVHRPGVCGTGPIVTLLAILDNGLYATGGAPSQLSFYIKRPSGILDRYYDVEYPVPPTGSGLHRMTLTLEGCE